MTHTHTHTHTIRVVIAVALWAEVEVNKNIQDVLDSADDVDNVLNQFGPDVSGGGKDGGRKGRREN